MKNFIETIIYAIKVFIEDKIKPISVDIELTKDIAQRASAQAEEALEITGEVQVVASEAKEVAISADINAQNAHSAATDAQTIATESKDLADNALLATEGKMEKLNPVGTGSFSMNRLKDSEEGSDSFVAGNNTTASAFASSAIGYHTIASRDCSSVEGKYNVKDDAYVFNEVNIQINTKDVCLFKRKEGFYLSTEYEVKSNRNFVLKNPIFLSGQSLYTNLSTYAGYYAIFNRAPNHDTATVYHYIAENTSTGQYICKLTTQATTHSSSSYKFSTFPTVWDAELINTYAHIVGNGESDTTRSNAHTLDWDGNAWYAGDVYVGSEGGVNRDEGSKKLATEEFVEEAITKFPTPDVSGQIETHNADENAHSNMGWLTGEDEEAGEPTPIDADTLGGHSVEYFAVKQDINIPMKGVDYYTEEDKAEIIQLVLAEIPIIHVSSIEELPNDAKVGTLAVIGGVSNE